MVYPSPLFRNRFWLLVGVLVGVLPSSYADAIILNSSISTLGDTGDESSSTAGAWSEALAGSVTMPTGGGNLLVIASASAQSQGIPGQSRTGSWRLNYDTQNSTAVDRFLSGSNDLGMLTTAHIFTNVSQGSQSFSLQHATDTSNRTILTRDVNMVAIPLASSDASVSLNYGQQTLTNPYTTTSTSLESTGLSTSVTLDVAGKIAVFSSFSSRTNGGTGSRTGSWDLQVNGPSGWTTIGTETDRYLGGTSDTGAVSLMALTEQLDAGTYDIRLRTATSDGADSIDTFNATLAGVALSFSGGYFPSFQSSVVSDSTTAAWDTVDGLSPDPNLTIEEGAVFIGSSFNLSKSDNDGSASTGEVAVGFDDPTYTAVAGGRYISDLSPSSDLDVGNGGSVGLTGTLSAGTYEGSLHFGRESGNDSIVIDNANLIGFSMVSVVPEPSTLVLALMGAISLYIWRYAKTRP
jgi:hypothetical protein